MMIPPGKNRDILMEVAVAERVEGGGKLTLLPLEL